MATGLQRLVRRALLATLKADTALTDLVPTASMNPRGEPAWPFIMFAAPVTRPLLAANLAGQEGSIDVHAFARDRLSGGTVVETGEDHAGRIGENIERLLTGNRLALDNGGTVRVTLSDARLLKDQSPDAWHYFAQVNWRALAD